MSDDLICPECESPHHTFRDCPVRDSDPNYDEGSADAAPIDLSELTDDGDVVELPDGRSLRLRIEVDQDSSINDYDFYGKVEWTRHDEQRPSDFDGDAEVIKVDYPHKLWWQPARGEMACDFKRGTPEFAKWRRDVLDLVEYGFKSVGLELLDGEDAYGRPVVKEAQWLGGIDSLENGYLQSVLSDLLAEMNLD